MLNPNFPLSVKYCASFFSIFPLHPPISTLFPYTTLFLSYRFYFIFENIPCIVLFCCLFTRHSSAALSQCLSSLLLAPLDLKSTRMSSTNSHTQDRQCSKK